MNGKYRSYALTIRPKDGIPVDSNLEKDLIKYVEKKQYYAYVFEKEDEARHFHAQIWLEVPTRKDDIQKTLKRIQGKHDPNWGPASQKVLVSGVKIAYNDSFSDNYLSKEYDSIYNPPNDTTEYYPTEEEQTAVRNRAQAVDKGFHKLQELFNEDNIELSADPIEALGQVGRWYYKIMFIDKKIPVIIDDKRRKQTCKCLLHYIRPMISTAVNMNLTKEDCEHYILIQENKIQLNTDT